MELTSALQSEQHVKKEIARKMGQLQEDLHNSKEQVRDLEWSEIPRLLTQASILDVTNFLYTFFQMMERIQECSSLQEQRDQYLAYLQQYTTGYQQLVSEREHLHKQFLQQTQLMDRLQHDEVQGKVQLEQSQIELQQAQVSDVWNVIMDIKELLAENKAPSYYVELHHIIIYQALSA